MGPFEAAVAVFALFVMPAFLIWMFATFTIQDWKDREMDREEKVRAVARKMIREEQESRSITRL